jgi:hypothetical protein
MTSNKINSLHINGKKIDRYKPANIESPLDFTRSQDYAGSDNNDNIEKLLEYYI